MTTKLCVSNLSRALTLANLREPFGSCGDVFGVEWIAGQTAPALSSAAVVTMATPNDLEYRRALRP